MTANSLGETVEQLLTRLNLSVGEDDTISWPLSDETYDGMRLRVERVIHQTQTYTTTIPHNTSYYQDPSLPAGMEEVVVEGVDGELLCTATVTYINGVETRRTVHSEIVAAPPVTEVVAIGTAPVDAVNPSEMPIIGDGYIILPTGEVLTYTDTMTVGATAYYCEPWERGITYSGTQARVGEIAVDPSVIPLGTRMFIISNDGAYVYGIAIAEDTGYLIEDTRVDLYFNTYEECVEFGYRQCTVFFLGTEK
jgi:3D (Asp-Asp-Asp) domain-containing protein